MGWSAYAPPSGRPRNTGHPTGHNHGRANDMPHTSAHCTPAPTPSVWCERCQDTGLRNHREVAGYWAAVDDAADTWKDERIRVRCRLPARPPAPEPCDECPYCVHCGVELAAHALEPGELPLPAPGPHWAAMVVPSCAPSEAAR